MIVNELKPLLGEGWKEKFKHRDLWDPDGYGVASFDLGGKREKVLAMNLETEDIMDHFYDDKPDDEWISLDRLIKLLNIEPEYSHYIRKDYYIKGPLGTERKLSSSTVKNSIYPKISISYGPSSKLEFGIHRIIATVFVPNPFPNKYDMVNHIDKDSRNFHIENLEWCDVKWNNLSENKKDRDEQIVYERQSDKKRFTRRELYKEYSSPNPADAAQKAAQRNTRWKGSYWKKVNLTLEDYLSRHPLQDDWYQHPTMPNVRANGCGVLEIDGKLKIGYRRRGYYEISINRKPGQSHRVILECYIGRELDKSELVDHIIPVTEKDTDNSIRNLRAVKADENMRNPLTMQNLRKEIKIYDLFGNLVDTVLGGNEFVDKYKIRFNTSVLVLGGRFLSDTNNTSFIYYKWKKEDSGGFICIGANSSFSNLYPHPRSYFPIKKKYLNTGMPAPDGCYYQQGDPQNMIYDPDNKDLIKKRPEIFWKDRNKNNNEEGN